MKLKVFNEKQAKTDTTQTPGINRKELVSTPNSWVGIARTSPRFTSGWHHHGNFETFIYVVSGKIILEFGKKGKDKIEAKAGEVVQVPKHTIHRESNPTGIKQVLYVVRIGKGNPTVNMENPEQ